VAHKSVVEIVHDVLTDEHLDLLRTRLGASAASTDTWDAALDGVVTAAFAEYMGAMLTSIAPITRADEVQQQRLLELIRRHAFPSGLPTETQVAMLFHLTPTRARSLLRNVLARFEAELDPFWNDTLRRAIATASRDRKDTVTIYIGNPLVADGLQAMLDRGNAAGARSYPLKRLVRDADVRGRWTIPFDAYKYLCEVLKVPVADPKA